MFRRTARATTESAATKILLTVQDESNIAGNELREAPHLKVLRDIGEGGFSLHEVETARELAKQTVGTPKGSIIANLAKEILGKYNAQWAWQKLLANLRDPQRDVTPSRSWVNHIPLVPPEQTIREWEKVITDSQKTLAATVNKGEIHRGFHAKTIFAEPGQLTLYANPAIPEGARVGMFAPNADPSKSTTHKVAVRGSNGQGCPFLKDSANDVRGLAVQGDGFSLTATNQTKGQHVPTAKRFVDFAKAVTRATASGLMGLLGQGRNGIEIAKEFGTDAPGVLARLTRDTLLPPASLATESFAGSIIRLGDYAAKVVWVPTPDTEAGTKGGVSHSDPDYLSKDAEARGKKKWTMCLQFYTNKTDTPMDNATKPWKTPLIPVGELKTMPSTDAEIRKLEREAIDKMRFNPGDFDAGPAPAGRPDLIGALPDIMGNVRKRLYDKSADERGAWSLEVGRAYIRGFNLSGR